MIWYCIALYCIVLYCIVLYCMARHGTVRYGMVWYGMVWYGMVWYGMVWYGMVWYGMIWYGSDDREDLFVLHGIIMNSELSTYFAVASCVRILGGRSVISWWRHQMETFSALLALCEEFTGHRWISHTKASDAELWCLLFCIWTNNWANKGNTGDLRCHRAHYDFTVMFCRLFHVDSGNAGMFASITTMQSMMCANDRLHCNSKVILIHVHITPS